MTALVIVALGLIVVCVVVFLIRKKGAVQGSLDAQGIDRLMRAGSGLKWFFVKLLADHRC